MPPVTAELPALREIPLDHLAADAVANIGTRVVLGPGGRMAFVPAPTPDDAFLTQIVDSTGRLVAKLGRFGSGPGELRMPWMVGFDSDSSLVIYDLGLRRIAVYSVSGVLLASLNPGMQMPLAMVGDSLDFRDAARPNAPYTRRPLMGRHERILIPGREPVMDSLFPVITRGGVQGRGKIAYAAGAGRIALGHAISYHILLYDDSGRYLGHLGRSLPPQFPSAEQLAAESLSTLKLPISPARRARLLRESREQPIIFFWELRFDEQGRLWVLRSENGSAMADVYADTRLLGSIAVDCPGFNGQGWDVNFGWLVLSCRHTDPDAPSDGTFRLFRIEGE